MFLVSSLSLRAETPAEIIRPRFQIPMDQIASYLRSFNNREEFAKNLHTGRGYIFALEGIVKLYAEKYGRIGRYRGVLKRFEDNLGWYGDTEDRIVTAKKMGLTPEKNPSVFAYLEAQRAAQYEVLTKILITDGWITPDQIPADMLQTLQRKGWEPRDYLPEEGPLLKRLTQTLDKTEWHSLKKDHEYLAEQVRDHIEDHLLKRDYDMEDLESMHKFRRDLRWLLIYLQVMNGHVVLDNEEQKKKFMEILKENLKLTYGDLPGPENQPWHLFTPEVFYKEVTRAVQELGFAKDSGEIMEKWLVEALHQHGRGEIRDLREAEKKARELAKRLPDYMEPVSTGYRAQQRVLLSGLLKKMSKSFAEQAGWSRKDCRKTMEEIARRKAAAAEAAAALAH